MHLSSSCQTSRCAVEIYFLALHLVMPTRADARGVEAGNWRKIRCLGKKKKCIRCRRATNLDTWWMKKALRRELTDNLRKLTICCMPSSKQAFYARQSRKEQKKRDLNVENGRLAEKKH
jgi:hypothetical protein